MSLSKREFWKYGLISAGKEEKSRLWETVIAASTWGFSSKKASDGKRKDELNYMHKNFFNLHKRMMKPCKTWTESVKAPQSKYGPYVSWDFDVCWSPKRLWTMLWPHKAWFCLFWWWTSAPVLFEISQLQRFLGI